MEIDAATRATLELTRTLAGTRDGSLLATIDKTVTAPGSRLLAERLAAPLTAPTEIECRLDAVAFFADEPGLRKDVRGCLKAAPDMTRVVSRLALNRGGPRDLAALCVGIEAAKAVARLLDNTRDLPQELGQASEAAAGLDPALATRLSDALAKRYRRPPARRRFCSRGPRSRPRRASRAARRKPECYRRAPGALCRFGGNETIKTQAQSFSRAFHRGPASVRRKVVEAAA